MFALRHIGMDFVLILLIKFHCMLGFLKDNHLLSFLALYQCLKRDKRNSDVMYFPDDCFDKVLKCGPIVIVLSLFYARYKST